MKQPAAVKAILQRFMFQWPGLTSGIPFVFDDDVSTHSPTFARVSITMLGADQQTFGNVGNRKFLESGTIEIKLYGPANQGRGPLDQLAEYVKQIFQATRFGAVGTEEGILTFTTNVQEVRPQSDTQFWILLATTPFEFIDVR